MANLKKKMGAFFRGDKFSSSALTALVLAVIIVVNVALYALVRLFDLYLYTTEKTDLSLSGSTDAYFAESMKKAKEENKKVTISFCVPEDDIRVHSTGAFVYETAKYFEERYPDFIEVRYIDIITQRLDGGKGELVDLSKYKTDMRGKETAIRTYSMIFEYGETYRVVTDSYSGVGFADFYTLDSQKYSTSYNGEEVMAGLISWVVSDEHKNAYFTQNHSEIVDISFSNLLACAGYYVNVVDLQKDDIPSDCDMLVISNPSTDFKKSRYGDAYYEIEKIENYMQKGGNLYVALDPYISNLKNLEGLLSEYGIGFSTTELTGGAEVRNIVTDERDSVKSDGMTIVAEYPKTDLASRISKRVSSFSKGSVIVRDVCALELSGGAEPLLLSSDASVLDASGKVVDEGGSYAISAVSSRTEESGATSRVVVIPSVYLAVSDSLVSRGYVNKDFLFATFEEFFGAGNMPYGCKDVVYNTDTLENLKMGTAKLYTALIMLVPTAVSVVGAVVVIRRKNR